MGGGEADVLVSGEADVSMAWDAVFVKCQLQHLEGGADALVSGEVDVLVAGADEGDVLVADEADILVAGPEKNGG